VGHSRLELIASGQRYIDIYTPTRDRLLHTQVMDDHMTMGSWEFTEPGVMVAVMVVVDFISSWNVISMS
jgi:hypothetical protein